MTNTNAFESLCRTEVRERIRWEAKCEINGQLWTGLVRDLTARGAFFQAERCLSTGTVVDSDDAADVASCTDRVLLTLSQDVAPDVIFEFSGEVRWNGHSDLHDCGGFGILFENGPRLRDAA